MGIRQLVEYLNTFFCEYILIIHTNIEMKFHNLRPSEMLILTRDRLRDSSQSQCQPLDQRMLIKLVPF